MNTLDRKKHWEKIYSAKQINELSWFEPKPETSLNFIKKFEIHHDAKIIDIGGGDSFLCDNLIEAGYKDISVLDISETAIEKAKKRLGSKAEKINWIICDAAVFKPTEKYDFWHDRAAFHFLTGENEIQNYVNNLNNFISEKGIVLLGTFSENGPLKCSGIEIKQYSENSMTELLKTNFEKIECLKKDHNTPFNTTQNFIFCAFKKRKS